MRTFFIFLICFVLLTVQRITAQETFAPLITENTITFVHVDFSGIEIDTVKKRIQQAGEEFLRDLQFDEQSFKSTARELAIELDKLDVIIRPYFETITQDLEIKEIALIYETDLLFKHNIPCIVAVPWKNKTDDDLDLVRTRLNMENYERSRFVKIGDLLILPWDLPDADEIIADWAKNIKPDPNSKIYPALESVAGADIKLAAAMTEPLRNFVKTNLESRREQDENFITDLLSRGSQEIQWASISFSLSLLTGKEPPKIGDVYATVQVNSHADAVQFREIEDQKIEFFVNKIQLSAEENPQGGYTIPPLFFQFLKGAIRSMLPEIEGDKLVYRSKESFGISNMTLASAGVIGTALLLPAIQAAREAARRMQCSNNLKQVMLSLHEYGDKYTQSNIPPLYTVDKTGKPLHSWRVLILPYIGQGELYRKIRLDEPWDSEYNSQFHTISIPQFCCPSNPEKQPGKDCCYVGIAGEGFIPAMKERELRGRSLGTISDGLPITLGVIEVKEPFCWMDPTADITLDELAKGINQEGRCGSFHTQGCVAVMFNGACKFLSDSIDPQTLRKLGDIDDGEKLTLP